TLEAPVLAVRGEVVDQPEETKPEDREQHCQARLGESALRSHADRAEHRAASVDHEHREDDEQTTGGRERGAREGGAGKRGRGEDVDAHDAQEADGDEADEKRDDRGHGAPTRSSRGSATGEATSVGSMNTTHARRITTAASATAAIIPGMVMPESLSANP